MLVFKKIDVLNQSYTKAAAAYQQASSKAMLVHAQTYSLLKPSLHQTPLHSQ
ncbi:MAG: hypothetical protein WAW86_10775 [Gammaproteobacteria bacterium]